MEIISGIMIPDRVVEFKDITPNLAEPEPNGS